MSTSLAKTYYLAIDIETSGPSMVHHFIPCFGAALIDVDALVPREVRLFWIAQPPNTTWDDTTLKEFWTRPKNVAWYQEILQQQSSGTLPSLASTMCAFVEWVRSMVGALEAGSSSPDDTDGAKAHVRIVSDNPAFDLGWLSYYLALGTDGAVPHIQYLLNGRYIGDALDSYSFADGLCRRLRAPNLAPRDAYAQPNMSVWQALGISEWRRHVFTANGARHDHRPQNDAVAIGLGAALVARAALDMCRLHDGVALRSQYDVLPPPSLAMVSMQHHHHHHHRRVPHVRGTTFYAYAPTQEQPPLIYADLSAAAATNSVSADDDDAAASRTVP